jgi:DNA-binding NarL/FixJ family response regulator
MKSAGAAGYLMKDSVSDDLYALIRASHPAGTREIPKTDDVLSHAHLTEDSKRSTQDRLF